MELDLFSFFFIFCGVVVVAQQTRYPVFITNQSVNNPDVQSRPTPTVDDIDQFLRAAFAVGNSFGNMSSESFNSSMAGQLTRAYLEGTRRIPRLSCYRPKDCADVQLCGNTRSGFYRIYPYIFGDGLLVSCDLDTRCGGWTLIQRRLDGSVSFDKLWHDYLAGFGDLRSDFWLGLHVMNQLTAQSRMELLVEMSDYNGNSAWAKYDHFFVSDEQRNFTLLVSGYQGTAGNSFNLHNGLKFSTPDRDNDIADEKNCAAEYGSGWWFGKCSNVNLNGMYATRNEADTNKLTNIIWFTWRNRQSLHWVEMKIRPSQFPNLCKKG